jgi:AraC family transcriptional regulator of adaptative response/methylated-DNA-[protein]-cysteine methyltransferase
MKQNPEHSPDNERDPVPEVDPLIPALSDWIRRHADRALPLDELARKFGLSRYQVLRRFRAATGLTPRQYQNALRVDRVKRQLRQGRGVAEAIFEAGFGSLSRYYDQAGPVTGMTPAQYRRGGRELEIRLVERTSPFGWLTLAATGRGVCFVHFDDAAGRGESALRDEFPAARIERSVAEQGPLLAAWCGALEVHLEQRGPRPELPLDLFGTALQIGTWRFLAGLENDGSTLSYGELAAAVGSPRAVRAVASACGANRIALLVPCHRVIRADGGLGGYRWGLDRKRALLDAKL